MLHGKSTPWSRAPAAAPPGTLSSVESKHARLAATCGLHPKTVAKRRKRTGTADASMGLRSRRTAALAAAEEAMVVEFRRRALLPPDDADGSGSCPSLEGYPYRRTELLTRSGPNPGTRSKPY